MRPTRSCALFLFFALLVSSRSLAENAPAAPVKFASGVEASSLIELYTSEAKSDCLPAEKWFSELQSSEDLWKSFVPVSFHVDTWDALGWKDRFALKDSGNRLANYMRRWNMTSVYAPVVVVNGIEWGGWSRGQEIPKASRAAGVLSIELSRTGSLTVIFSPVDEAQRNWTAHAAIAGFDISSKIEEGENRGRKLTYDFLALGYQEANMRFSYGKFKTVLRSLSARKDISSKRMAVIAWVTVGDNPLPIQAVGGTLPS